jgi:hypothetical protein
MYNYHLLMIEIKSHFQDFYQSILLLVVGKEAEARRAERTL